MKHLLFVLSGFATQIACEGDQKESWLITLSIAEHVFKNLFLEIYSAAIQDRCDMNIFIPRKFVDVALDVRDKIFNEDFKLGIISKFFYLLHLASNAFRVIWVHHVSYLLTVLHKGDSMAGIIDERIYPPLVFF